MSSYNEDCSDRAANDSQSDDAGSDQDREGEGVDMLPPPLRQLGPGLSGNTGPKGVLADYREACAQLRFERMEKNARIARLMEKCAVGDAIEYVPAPPKEDVIRSENRHPDDVSLDEELEAIRARRMLELRLRLPEYGELVSVEAKRFIDFVEKIDKRSFVVISLYKPDVEACHRLNLCLEAIAPQFSRVRFAKMVITQALPNYDNAGLPALAVYQGGQQVHSFVPLWKHVREQYSDEDLVRLLCRHNVLSDDVLTNNSFDNAPTFPEDSIDFLKEGQ